ncbi:MAG: hypothetical protein LBH22_02835 [Bacteroidales bacterium]|nr:hypothetical protein [Bacteroidales bacterium]
MKTPILICMLCFFTFYGYSEKRVCDKNEQQQEERDVTKQKIQSRKIAFFTEKLSLTPEEARKFWPMYNAYFNVREQLTSSFFKETCCKECRMEKGEKEVDILNLSDAEATKIVNDRAKLFELEKKFHNDLCKLFSPQRVVMYYCVEREFQRELLRRHSEGSAKTREPRRR